MSSVIKKLCKLIIKPEDFDRIFSKAITPARFKLIATAGIARLLGRKVLCHRCGKDLPNVLTFISKGQLKVWGLQELPVRVDFADRQTLRFSHVIPEDCVSIILEH